MSNDAIFWTQIATIIAFVSSVFWLYRLLVEQKDSTIQLLKERASTLKEQLQVAKSATPDVLAQALSSRVKLLEMELGRLTRDHGANNEQIKEKEKELRAAKKSADALLTQLNEAKALLEEFSCPKCGSKLARREFASELVEYNGREIDVDHEFTEYECGYSVVDGTEGSPCRGR